MTERLTPFPLICPHCHAAAKYEAWKTVEDGIHLYGLTTWECGWAFNRWKDDQFGTVHEAETGKCGRGL